MIKVKMWEKKEVFHEEGANGLRDVQGCSTNGMS